MPLCLKQVIALLSRDRNSQSNWSKNVATMFSNHLGRNSWLIKISNSCKSKRAAKFKLLIIHILQITTYECKFFPFKLNCTVLENSNLCLVQRFKNFRFWKKHWNSKTFLILLHTYRPSLPLHSCCKEESHSRMMYLSTWILAALFGSVTLSS